MSREDAPLEVWSIGHSNHAADAFVALLAAHGIGVVADIRTVPKSRRHPQFHADTLAQSLAGSDIAYRHLPLLGGWRRPAESSPNGAWQNASFRGYADYALTAPFAEGLAELQGLAAMRRTAMMCSEALWWRCHRRLVADRLVVAGGVVRHIAPDGRASVHVLTSFARVGHDGRLCYPSEGGP